MHNWHGYEQALRQRADITLWFSQDAIAAWCEPKRRRPGGQRVYARTAIETALTVRMVFGLALRQTEGFLRSLCERLRIEIPIPDHTTLSRRARSLGKIPLAHQLSAGPLHLLIDSTGLSIHSGNQRGVPADRRRWRKLHVCVDSDNGQVTAAELTASGAHDSTRIGGLLDDHDTAVRSVTADGAYDTAHVYDALAQHAEQRGRSMPRVVIPPREAARPIVAPSLAMRQRNRNLSMRRKLGRRAWHKASGFSRRSRVENVFFRYKAIIGRSLRARSLAGQRLEARLGCRILNRMAGLGMPDSRLAA